ncbi:hypothetical protein [Deinococcus sp.]|uniref:hypothetical protein n=1 Tax=Deinococcus sp. TaxID=47478 RepID=UPI0025BBC1EA|nr:hypothetical protein [Deinococcus sp.]
MSPEPSAEVLISAAELLKFLGGRGGQEYRAVTVRRESQGKKAVWAEVSPYLFTLRGEVVEATGPSGQTRQLSPERFLEVFGSSLFRPAEATGRMTDLGPLFGA